MANRSDQVAITVNNTKHIFDDFVATDAKSIYFHNVLQLSKFIAGFS